MIKGIVISPRPIDWEDQSCKRKVCYGSKKQAEKKIGRSGFAYTSAYRCQFCNGWHIGGHKRTLTTKAVAALPNPSLGER